MSKNLFQKKIMALDLLYRGFLFFVLLIIVRKNSGYENVFRDALYGLNKLLNFIEIIIKRMSYLIPLAYTPLIPLIPLA